MLPFLWTVISKDLSSINQVELGLLESVTFQLHDRMLSSFFAQLLKKLWAFFWPWRRDRSQSPPCWKTLLFWGKTNTAIHDPSLYCVGWSTPGTNVTCSVNWRNISYGWHWFNSRQFSGYRTSKSGKQGHTRPQGNTTEGKLGSFTGHISFVRALHIMYGHIPGDVRGPGCHSECIYGNSRPDFLASTHKSVHKLWVLMYFQVSASLWAETWSGRVIRPYVRPSTSSHDLSMLSGLLWFIQICDWGSAGGGGGGLLAFEELHLKFKFLHTWKLCLVTATHSFHVGENYSYLLNLRSNIRKSCWVNTLFITNNLITVL